MDMSKIKTFPDGTDIGKIPISDGRYILVSTMSRLKDGTGAGVFLDLIDQKGNDISLAVLTDTTDGIEHGIRLMHASDPYNDDDMQQDWFWENDYFEDGEHNN